MRIRPADKKVVGAHIHAVLEAQSVKWGAPLLNHLVYARVPQIFAAVRSMWGGIDAAGRIEPSLQALVNRRVAAINGCEF